MRKADSSASALVGALAVLSLVLWASAATDGPAAGPAAPNTTGWFGNTFKGGDRNTGRWVQPDMDDIFVFPDGRVVANCGWNEAGRVIGVYKDRQVIGKVDDYPGLTGGTAVTADEQFIFALRTERKLGESDPMRHGVARYTLDGKPATWPGAEGWARNVLVLDPPSKQGGRPLTGVAAAGGELFLADPNSRTVKVYDAASMAVKRQFGLVPETDTPYKIVFDKARRLWICQRGGDGRWRLRAYDAKVGKYASVEIVGVGEPAGLALAPDGRLVVADNGSRQQVLFYDVSGAPALKSTLGVEGGVYAGPGPGCVADNRFCGLTGASVDQRGNVYVSTNGCGPYAGNNGFGAKLQCFDPSGKCLWTLEGLESLDSADVDRGEEFSAYTKDSRYGVDWCVPTAEGWPHAGWQHKAWTLHRLKYPNDPRLHVRQDGVRIVRLEDGRRLLSCQSDGHLCVYRFEGEIAVPAAVFAREGTKPGQWPPNNPYTNRAWMWADRNGDGEFQAGEFEAIAPGNLDVMRAFFLDDVGTAWIGEQSGTIHRFPLQVGDERTGALYTIATRSVTQAPADITRLRFARYVAASDTMYLATCSRANPMQARYPMAREIRRYDKWSTDRTHVWTTAIPYRFLDRRGQDNQPAAMDVEGNYAFVAYNLRASDEPRFGEVAIFRASDGTRAGSVWAGPEVGGRIGAVALGSAVHARRRSDGTYLILVGDEEFAKIIFYLWKPPVSAEPNR